MKELLLSAVASLALIASTVSLDARIDSDQCPPGRYSPHECVCSLYYECIDGLIVEKVCPSGESFDVNLERCVAAKDANCYQPEDQVYCPRQGKYVVADKRNCSVYYECVDGLKTEKVCSDGLSFDQELGICTWPPSIDCRVGTRLASRSTTIQPAENEKGLECPSKGHARLPHECLAASYYECIDGTMIGKECPDGSIYDRVKETCDDPNAAVLNHPRLRPRYLCQKECPPTGSDLIRHETDCSKFYRCARGVRKLDKCIDGRLFNCLLKTCDLEENAYCESDNTTEEPKPEQCPKCDCGIVRYPHSDCSMYYECEDGVENVHECPKGLYYDRKRKICNYFGDSDCEQPGCVEGEKVAHQCQCDRYYVCVNGEKVVKLCPPGKHFDADRKVCDDPDKANCKPNANRCIGNCSTSTENLPHEDCSKYCVCDQGVSRPVDCPSNQIYDTETNKCQFPENVKNPRCDPFPCDSDTLLPHQCYCDRYYRCRNRTKILQWCEDGKHFDYERKSCVLCGDAHCFAAKVPGRLTGCERGCSPDGSEKKSIAHEDCAKYCACNDCNGQTIKDCPPKRYYDPRTGRCERPENVVDLPCDPFPCTPGADENLPHECDCTLYYKCENGKMLERQCPDGTKYDYDKAECVRSGAHCYYKNTSSVYNGKERRAEFAWSNLPFVGQFFQTVRNI